VQDGTDSGVESADDHLMSKQSIVEPASQVNERRWQTWVVKNRELDRRSAARRLRLLKVVVAVILVGVALHRYLG